MTSTDPHRHAGGADDDPMHNPGVAHEDTDINVATVLKFAVGMFVTVAVCALIVGGIFRVLDRQAAARDPQLSPLARPAGQTPQGPRLETNEPRVLGAYRKEQAAVLEGYGWVDQAGGVARIPVAEAKKLLVQRGLPIRAEGAAPGTAGTRRQAYGEASGGRTVR